MTTRRRTILLKLSGEALKAGDPGILDARELARICAEIAAVPNLRLGLVVGGGNIVRGRQMTERMADPVRGDAMGMLATLINAIALRDGLEAAGRRALVVAPHEVPGVAERYERDRVRAALDDGEVVVFGGGTGHPFFSTDTAAALRAAEIDAEVLLKASSVDGVYSADPRTDPQARRFERLSFDEAIAGRYAVMDLTAFALCRERRIPIRVFDMQPAGALTAALGPNPPGTLVG